MDAWIRLEYALCEILKVDRHDATQLGLSATHLAGYFKDEEGAANFLKALRKRVNKYRRKKCGDCGHYCYDSTTGVINLKCGLCKSCYKKRWGSLKEE